MAALTLVFYTPFNNYPVSLPISGTATYNNSSFDWGDGNVNGSSSHIYTYAGQYTVNVYPASGAITRIGIGYSWQGAQALHSVITWPSTLTSLNAAFFSCTTLVSVPNSIPSGVTDLSSMFYQAVLFNQNINSWNVNNVTNMGSVFYGAIAFNQPLDNWNTSSVTNMGGMFGQATSFNQSIGNWNVSNVANMISMFFQSSSFNQPIGDWNVSSVSIMTQMFYGATAFNQPIGDWNVSNVIHTNAMFYNATSFNQPIGDWNVSSVTDMKYMFADASAFDQPIGDWDVSLVTDMRYMFSGAVVFNQPLYHWNVSSVTNMQNMFAGASAFNQYIEHWNVSSVTNMAAMFANAVSFNKCIDDWDTCHVTNMDSMFSAATVFNHSLGCLNIRNVNSMSNMLDNSGLSIRNYSDTLIHWSRQPVQLNVPFGALDLVYNKSAVWSRSKLINIKHWVISGDSLEVNPICYAKGVMILTDNGYVPIEDLKIGDLIKTYKHGYLPIDKIRKNTFTNDPNNWKNCMYRIPAEGFGDLIVTGGHGILKKEITPEEFEMDKYWLTLKYSRIDDLILQRAAFNPDFQQINSTQDFDYYHFSLASTKNRRYGVWANGILSESTFNHLV